MWPPYFWDVIVGKQNTLNLYMVDAVVQFFLKEIAERLKARNTPKARSGRALLDIYNTMLDCQEAYLAWKKSSHKKRGNKKYEGKEYEEWRQRVLELDAAFMRCERKLRIMAPDVHGNLDRYFRNEVEATSRPTAGSKSVLTRFLPKRSISIADLKKRHGVDDDLALSFEGFEVSVESLRSFIRDNYSWDDLFS